MYKREARFHWADKTHIVTEEIQYRDIDESYYPDALYFTPIAFIGDCIYWSWREQQYYIIHLDMFMQDYVIAGNLSIQEIELLEECEFIKKID